jgi:hypothetical protein
LDNGGEYTSKEFKGFYMEGIKRELIVPYNPWKNRVAKQKNRSIIGVAKAMMHDQNLLMFLWARACNTTVYIQNKCPHRILEDKTLGGIHWCEAIGKSFLHLCLSNLYPCIGREKDQRITRSTKDYNETSKDYKVYIPEQRKTILSWDVNFEEDFTSKKSREPIPLTEDEEQEVLKVEPRSPMISKVVE